METRGGSSAGDVPASGKYILCRDDTGQHNDAKNQIEDLKDQKKDAEDTVNDISGKKDALESDLSGLNGQLSDIVAQINDLEGQISDKQGEIDQAKEDLAAAEAQSAKQYEDMKLRIQFMYENGSTPVWQMLAEAESFSDFLNRTEYITDINAYDRKKACGIPGSAGADSRPEGRSGE